MNEINAIITIALRDVIRFFRDRTRLIFLLIFPLIFIGIIGGMLGQNIAGGLGFNYLQFVFIGVIIQTLFQTTVGGLVNIVRDRENDFTQEMFVAPISRFSIIMGKILGASFISVFSIIGIIIYGFIAGIHLTGTDFLLLLPVGVAACLVGGAFGLLMLGNMKSQESANMIFPFIMFPQMFVAGVISPVNHSGWFLTIISHIAPLTYIVDFAHGMMHYTHPEYKLVSLYSPLIDIIVMSCMFLVFVSAGTYAFVRNERNK